MTLSHRRLPAASLCALLLLILSAPGQAANATALTLQQPDIAAVLASDAAAHSGPQRFRYAVPVGLSADLDNSGQWSTLADGRQHWQLEVSAPGAHSLSFAFAGLQLPDHAELSIRSERDSQGPFAADSLNAGALWTPVVRGDHALISLTTADRSATRLQLTEVQWGFRGFGAADDESDKSGACNVDVSCSEASGWENEVRSVARFTINGLFLCSGQLINNTANDFTPYFLTAAHCLSSEAEALTTVFYFNYETSSCGGTPDGQLSQTVSGALLRAGAEVPSLASPDVSIDFALLELLSAPPANFEVYYSGWDRRDVAPNSVTGIHHPAGDEKRISFEFDALAIAAYLEEPGSLQSNLNPTHLKVSDWDIGTTEGGSSGSGIWNENHHLVGQLSGGYAACGNDDADWYGRFALDWDRLPTPRTSVASWLDPRGTGAETLDGADPNGLDELPPPEKSTASTVTTPAAGALHSLLLLALAGLLLGRSRSPRRAC